MGYKWKPSKAQRKAFAIRIDDIKAKYWEWLQSKDPDWVLYYGHQTVYVFIDDIGLKLNREQLEELQEILVDVRHKLPYYNETR